MKCHVCAGKDCTEIVKKAFEKQLAIEKVGLECELKLSKLAMENNDSHTCHFIGCCTEMKVCHDLVPHHACNTPQNALHSNAGASFCLEMPLNMVCIRQDNCRNRRCSRAADAEGKHSPLRA